MEFSSIVQLNISRESADMYQFVYHIKTIGLNWQEIP